MKQTLYYLSGFNNYFNRQVKKPSATEVAEYQEWIVHSTNPTNFNPNDGVSTTMVVNYTDTELDYMIASEDNVTISSRWFVIERKRNLAGQYTVTLRRDLMADYFQEIITSPCYIERAMLDIGNNLIFNSEGNSYNQIKKDEFLLQDETRSGWIVGYMALNSSDINVDVTNAGDNSYPLSEFSIDQLRLFNGGWSPYTGSGYPQLSFKGNSNESSTTLWNIYFYNNGSVSAKTTSQSSNLYDIYFNTSNIDEAANLLSESIKRNNENIIKEATDYAKTLLENYIDEVTLKKLMSMSGGTFIDSDGTEFRITVRSQYINHNWNIGSNAGALINTLSKIVFDSEAATFRPGTPSNNSFSVYYSQLKYIIDVEVLTTNSEATIKTSVSSLQDAPYKMFAIPYGEISITHSSTFTNQPNVATKFASRFATTLGSKLYDLQLLPYCPFRSVVVDGGIDVSQVSIDNDYTLINLDDNVPASIILWPSFSSFHFMIEKEISIPSDTINFKIDHETKFIRLCSPNYSGAFEFKATSNRGISAFEFNITYKPFNPYIHVAPLFNSGSLYGNDFNDERGLVCTGDFSLPIVTDAWIQYQINNKSYQDSFDRQIENMETNYSINRRQQEIAGTINVLSAGLGGFAGGTGAGGIAGLGIGASAGIGLALGAASAVGSGIGLQADLRAMEQLHREAVSYNTDQFNYQLQNIKALPYSLGKVGAFNINNKIFPFIEFYEATEEEVEALRMKLKYNSFTVGVIGTIQPYIQSEPSFIQGKFIRLLGDADYHLSVEIASEFHKGVYI